MKIIFYTVLDADVFLKPLDFFLLFLKWISQATPFCLTGVSSVEMVDSSSESSEYSSSLAAAFDFATLTWDAAGEASPDEEFEPLDSGFSMWHTSLCFSTELSSRLQRAPSPTAVLEEGPGYIVTGCSLTNGSGSFAKLPRRTALWTALMSMPSALRPPLQLPGCRMADNPLDELAAETPPKFEALTPQHGKLE